MTDRVYRIPVVLTVRSQLFVLADDVGEACRQSQLIDPDDLFTFDPTTITSLNVRRLKFDDIIVAFADHRSARLLPTSSYHPNKHPDFVRVPRK